jgi:hypothetical protein
LISADQKKNEKIFEKLLTIKEDCGILNNGWWIANEKEVEFHSHPAAEARTGSYVFW